MTIGSVLREARITAQLTQKQIADALSVTAQYVSDIENDRRDLPDKYVERLPEAIRRHVATAKLAELANKTGDMQRWAY